MKKMLETIQHDTYSIDRRVRQENNLSFSHLTNFLIVSPDITSPHHISPLALEMTKEFLNM